jgi:DNA-binding HxlR family transcriptional regulator
MTGSTVTMTGALDPRGGWEARRCAIARALEVVGSRSAFLILREAFYGTTRFEDFAERAQISEPVAAARLRELVGAGLLERRPYREPGQRTRLGYHLAEAGADFFPALAALMQWGERWLGPGGVEMRHHACGGAIRAELRCAEGHPVTISEIDLAPRTGTGAGSGSAEQLH